MFSVGTHINAQGAAPWLAALVTCRRARRRRGVTTPSATALNMVTLPASRIFNAVTNLVSANGGRHCDRVTKPNFASAKTRLSYPSKEQ